MVGESDRSFGPGRDVRLRPESRTLQMDYRRSAEIRVFVDGTDAAVSWLFS